MENIQKRLFLDYPMLIGVGFLTVLSVIVLNSIAPHLFPSYFLYIVLAFAALFIFMQVDFDVISIFSRHLYVASIIFLLLPIIIGQVTRGTIRWIPLGPLTIQPAEIVRPFLLVFFANYLTQSRLDIKSIFKAFILLLLPFFLILIQPSLGVAVITAVGFVGILLAADMDKKYLAAALGIFILLIPVGWQFLEPYQKDRIVSFADPSRDPLGTGYNSLQSMISIGSGKIFGRGLGRGVQTQLAFLPEKHTDFVFAAVGEEMGFVGAVILALASLFVLLRLVIFIERTSSPAARAYVSGFFATMFVQAFVHMGMNLGLLPITGVPLPLVSAGGSSLLATMIGLGIALGARKNISLS